MNQPKTADAGETATLTGTGTPGAKVTVVVDEREGKAPNRMLTATVNGDGEWTARSKASREALLTASDGASTATRTLRVRADLVNLKAKRSSRAVRVSGALRPGDKSVKVTVNVRARKVTVRTGAGGKFTATIRNSVSKGAKVTIRVAADRGSYDAKTETIVAR